MDNQPKIKPGMIVQVTKDSECPITGFKNGTIGIVVSKVINDKCFVATEKHKFGGYYGWYISINNLKIIREEVV